MIYKDIICGESVAPLQILNNVNINRKLQINQPLLAGHVTEHFRLPGFPGDFGLSGGLSGRKTCVGVNGGAMKNYTWGWSDIQEIYAVFSLNMIMKGSGK
jgi:hypothetical protein